MPTKTPLTLRPVGAMMRLREPMGQHTDAERLALARHVSGRKRVVEIGVAEGVSAATLRETMDPRGTLWLVDPLSSRYPISPRRVVAKRVVGAVGEAKVHWVFKLSLDAAAHWDNPIDFLFIDADHAESACEADWNSWSPHVVRGGLVAFHDSAVSPTSHAHPDWGPVKVVDRYFRDRDTAISGWEILEEIDSLTVVERVT